MTAYTNYCIGTRLVTGGNPIRRDKLSIYAFSLLRRADHSALARGPGPSAAARELRCIRIVAECIVQIYEKERPQRCTLCNRGHGPGTSVWKAEFARVSISRLTASSGARYGEVLRSRMNSGSFCKLIAYGRSQ